MSFGHQCRNTAVSAAIQPSRQQYGGLIYGVVVAGGALLPEFGSGAEDGNGWPDGLVLNGSAVPDEPNGLVLDGVDGANGLVWPPKSGVVPGR